jgi:hypothetical protein
MTFLTLRSIDFEDSGTLRGNKVGLQSGAPNKLVDALRTVQAFDAGIYLDNSYSPDNVTSSSTFS